MNDQLAQTGGAIAPASTTLQATEQTRAMAEVQAAFTMAAARPRDEFLAMEKIVNACKRVKLAESAEYAYPRGGQQITGPSIRLAETCARYWGNMRYGVRELSQGNGTSEMQAYCQDLETNVIVDKIFQVRHERYSRAKGNTALDDPRDIYELTANNGSRRVRACILAVIPQDVIDSAMEQVAKTLSGQSDMPLADRIKLMVEAFDEFNVSEKQIELRFGKNISALRESEVNKLRQVYTSLKDGMSKPEQWFEPTQTEKVSSLKERMTKVTEKDPESNGSGTVDTETGEVLDDVPFGDSKKKRSRRTNWQIRIDELKESLAEGGAQSIGVDMAIEQALDMSEVKSLEDVPKDKQDKFVDAVKMLFKSATGKE